jgi:hypothetical protein
MCTRLVLRTLVFNKIFVLVLFVVPISVHAMEIESSWSITAFASGLLSRTGLFQEDSNDKKNDKLLVVSQNERPIFTHVDDKKKKTPSNTFYITDVIQKYRSSGKTFIYKPDLVQKYAKYHSPFDGEPLYQPESWTTFDQIPSDIQENIRNEYYGLMIKVMLADKNPNGGKFFLSLLKNAYSTAIDGKKLPSDRHILSTNIYKILFLEELYQTVPPEIFAYIWTLVSRTSLIAALEDIYAGQLHGETELESMGQWDYGSVSKSNHFRAGQPGLARTEIYCGDADYCHVELIDPIQIDKRKLVKVTQLSKPSFKPIEIKSSVEIELAHDYPEVRNFNLDGTVLGCVMTNAHNLYAYDLTSGNRLLTNPATWGVSSCDISHGLVVVLRDTQPWSVQILSTHTDRVIHTWNDFRDRKTHYTQEGLSYTLENLCPDIKKFNVRFKITRDYKNVETGDITLFGDNKRIECLSPFNIFEHFESLRKFEELLKEKLARKEETGSLYRIAFFKLLAAQYAATIVKDEKKRSLMVQRNNI